MEENLDNLSIKLLMSCLVIAMIFLYRIMHNFVYPTGKKNYIRIFTSQTNPADAIHFYARIIGSSILIFPLVISFHDDFLSIGVHLLTWSIINFSLFLGSLYFLENSILNNFDFRNEILKKENYAYAIVSASLSLCFALSISFVVKNADFSIPIVTILWFLSLIFIGINSKIYSSLTRFQFTKDILSKNLGTAISFSGFIFGTTLILFMCFNQEYVEFSDYFIQITSDLALCLIFLPIFYLALRLIYLKNNNFTLMLYVKDASFNLHLGAGLTEATLFITSSILTTLTVFHLGIT